MVFKSIRYQVEEDRLIYVFHALETLFTEEFLNQLSNHFEILINKLLDDSRLNLQDILFLSESEYNQMIYSWNKTDKDYPKDLTIHKLFEIQVEKNPDNIALVYEEHQITYRQLNEKANQLARHIRLQYQNIAQHSLPPDTLIAICVERGIEMMVGILAILKAGCAYVAIDPQSPKERMRHILENAQIKIILMQQQLFKNMHSDPHLLLNNKILIWDDKHISLEISTNLASHNSANHLAYVVYTSGTTGQPKGIMIEHRSVHNLISSIKDIYQFKEKTNTVAAFFSYIFDGSVFEFFGTLSYGGKLHILPNDVRTNPNDLSEYLIKNKIAYIFLPPAMLAILPKINYPYLKTIMVGSEKCDQLVADYWSNCYQLFNFYGPSETTVCTTGTIAKKENINIIGKAIDNTKLYVLDNNLNPVPINVFGELYVSGIGLARGYLHQPELTAKYFIPNPFTTAVDRANIYNMLYKTGDIVRWLPDGNLEYLGRRDFQVKLRGHRIELEEIENTLNKHPNISQSVVLLKCQDQNTFLTAYYVSPYELCPNNLREYLISQLPEYMVPTVYVYLQTLPLNINGKLDRHALPEPHFKSRHTYVAPRNELEKKICAAWEEVLNSRPISITDNFFDLGGNSILAIRLIYQIEKALNQKLPLKILYRFSTIKEMTENITFENSQPQETNPKENNKPQLSSKDYRLLLSVIAGAKAKPIQLGSLIACLYPERPKKPIFWCGNGYDEQLTLAEYLDRDQPLYTLFSGLKAIEDATEPYKVKMLAAHYVREILSIQPYGAYVIGGNCRAGRLATEIAFQLLEKNKKVDLLCLLEFFDPKLFDYPGEMLLLYGKEGQQAYEAGVGKKLGRRIFFKTIPKIDWVEGDGTFSSELTIKMLAEKVSVFPYANAHQQNVTIEIN